MFLTPNKAFIFLFRSSHNDFFLEHNMCIFLILVNALQPHFRYSTVLLGGIQKYQSALHALQT